MSRLGYFINKKAPKDVGQMHLLGSLDDENLNEAIF